MKPVLSSTGAVRLEDVEPNTLLVQILTKSMLMDQKAGRRLVDGCTHENPKGCGFLKKNPRASAFSGRDSLCRTNFVANSAAPCGYFFVFFLFAKQWDFPADVGENRGLPYLPLYWAADPFEPVPCS